jgi:hypothetical protein
MVSIVIAVLAAVLSSFIIIGGKWRASGYHRKRRSLAVC